MTNLEQNPDQTNAKGENFSTVLGKYTPEQKEKIAEEFLKTFKGTYLQCVRGDLMKAFLNLLEYENYHKNSGLGECGNYVYSSSFKQVFKFLEDVEEVLSKVEPFDV